MQSSYFHIVQYAKARKTKGSEQIRSDGFYGMSRKVLDELESNYKHNVAYALCKWCDVETTTPKNKAPILGVVCSDQCNSEIKGHYS